MRTFFLLVGTAFWCAFVFVATLWLTFPSEEFGLRLRAEVPERLGRDYTAEVGAVGPWWLGLSAAELKLYKAERAGAELVGMFDGVAVAVSPLRSLWRRTPYFVGELQMLDGSLGFQLGTRQAGKKGNTWGLSDVVLWSDAVPIGDLLRLTGRVPATLTGNVALDVDVRGGAEGMSEANGHFRVEGSGLVLSDIELPSVGPLGMEIPIDKILLEGKVEQGQATFENAIVSSPWFTLELKGSIGLRDPLDRSNVDLELVVSNLGEQLASYESLLTSAKGTDGSYHFYGRGILGRLSASSWSAGKPTASRVGRRDRAVTDDEAIDGGEGSDVPVLSPSESDDDRQRRRQEIRDRLRERREARRAERLGKPVTPADDEPTNGAVVPAPVEEPPVEELPPAEEEPIDEEPPPVDEEDPVE